MNKKLPVLITLVSAVIFTAVFYKQTLGLNLLLFESLLTAWLFISKQVAFKGKIQVGCLAGLIITSLFTVLTHSAFSIIVNYLLLFVLSGIIIYPEAKSLISSAGISFIKIFASQGRFINEISDLKIKGHRPLSFIWKSRIFIIPLLVIVLFIALYRNSNPVFDKLVVNAGHYFRMGWDYIFKDIDFLLILTFLFGLAVSNFFFMKINAQSVINSDLNSDDDLKRKKRKFTVNFRFNALKNEYKSGIFLLLLLNLILMVLNVIDIYWVWFNFKWEGQYLKQFVHEGTYLLILSVIISIILVLYFFRGNINYYSGNKFLKYLASLWLVQNGILTISVAIRNFWYINYFSLAYKRIGVIIFLILTFYGLITVLIKVRHRKSAFYLFRTNANVLVFILIISSIINWDNFIAKYNFKHSENSFLHLDFMSTLPDKTLPYLDKSLDELSRIDKVQKEKFPFEQKFMNPLEYYKEIEFRKMKFKKRWESKSILSWNLPEYMAYRKLFSQEYISQKR
jgi:hypothetical protein